MSFVIILSFLAIFSAVTPAPLPEQAGAFAEDVRELGGPADSDGGTPSAGPPAALLVEPKGAQIRSTGVEWGKLGRDSMFFLTIMHGFRWIKEPGTRAGGIGLGAGYTRSVGNLHGWGDGDPFYVNYIGHPMQGAVTGRLYLVNAPRYNRTEFGKSPEYWKGKLRAAAFAWAFSEQFEIGPVSEASIGHIQADYPQQGFVDHVITPGIGLGWMIGEDALDRYVIRPAEDRINNIWVRIALRSALNPARAFANVVDGRAPWDRDSRAGILRYRPAAGKSRSPDNPAGLLSPSSSQQKPAPFEFTLSPSWHRFPGNACVGGGAEAAWRLMPAVQIALAVNGCKLLGLPANTSGDALTYQIGPRWTPSPTGKWSPYAHLLMGGLKITHEQLYPDKQRAILEANMDLDPSLAHTLHDQYTRHGEASGLAFSLGTGVDYKLNAGLAIRVASVEYLRSTLGALGGMSYGRGLQLKTGLVVRLGTW